MARSKTSLVYEQLKRQLLDGVYAPGSKLKIDLLSESLDVSPGAVREALSRLTSEGLVQAVDQRGFVVAPISAADLIDLTDVRIAIETRCLRRAILVGDLEWETGVAAAWHRLSHLPPVVDTTPGTLNPAWVEAHDAFHDSLIAGSDSPWWLRLRQQLYVQAERYRRLLLPHARVQRDPVAEHAALAESVLGRRADEACERMRAHLQLTTDILLASDAPFADVPHKARVQS